MTPRRRAIAASFDRAAEGYDRHAALQMRAAGDLAQRIGGLELPAAPRILEIGCGTGLLTAALLAGVDGARIVATDVAASMVRACRARLGGAVAYAVMDGDAPCVGAPRFDLVCASLAFQWLDDLPTALASFHDLLAPGGRLAFVTLGPETLSLWREAHRLEGVAPPPMLYPAPERIAAAWPGRVAIDRQRVDIAYADGLGFLRMLRGLGARHAADGHRPLAPGALRRVLARFEADFGACADYDLVFAVLARSDE